MGGSWSRSAAMMSNRVQEYRLSTLQCGSSVTGEIRVALVRGMETAGRLTAIWIHSPTAVETCYFVNPVP